MFGFPYQPFISFVCGYLMVRQLTDLGLVLYTEKN